MSDKNTEFDIIDFANRIAKHIEENFKLVLGLCIAALVGASIWAFMSSAEKSKQQKAFSKLFEVTKIYQEKKDNFQKAKDDKTKPKKPEAKDKDPKAKKENLTAASGDINKDYPEVVQKLEAFLSENADSNAAGEAALTLSEIYDEYKMPEKGAEAVTKVIGKWSHKNVLFYVLQMRAGDLWASANQCEKAVSYWEVVAGSESFIAQQAQLKLGVCLQEIGKIEEAKTWFKKIQADSPNSAEGFSAKRYLRYLEFKAKTGESNQSDNKAQQNEKTTDKAS